jgi:hypothetical protein
MADDVPRRRRGRPQIDPTDPSPSVPVHLMVSARTYDKVFALARRHELSVPELLRRALKRGLTTRDPER